MSHPIIVDTVENSFVPLLTVNNSVSDTIQLKRFNEPSWNYQVVRFLDAKGNDIIPRKDKVWNLHALTKRMITALETANSPVPPLLSLLEQESATQRHAKAAFSMYCYWTGEVQLGAIEGVVSTEAGYFDGHEVTLVTYDTAAINLQQLVKKATAIKCFERLYVPAQQLQTAKNFTSAPVTPLTSSYKKAKDSDQKRQLRGTPFAKLNLSLMQASKVNAFARTHKQKALGYLTARQRASLSL